MERGRPSKYKEEYCEALIEHMAEGLSFESFAASISVDRDTLYEWSKVHKNFSDAKRVGVDKNILFYERIGVRGMLGEIDNFNATTWIFNMKNRHKWRDKQPDENDVVVNNVSNISDSELDARIKDKMSKVSGK